jgi:hypothetical protein
MHTITLEHENRIYSQNGEDGVLAHIFGTIGVLNTTAVEFGVGNGYENNSRLLAALGWRTFWFDCGQLRHLPHGCHFQQTMLTVDNICETFAQAGIPSQFDLLSVDVDGNDYHLREAVSQYSPRACVMEYNGSFAADQEYVMPRDDNYQWKTWDTRFGASLRSLTQQADRLGYDLVYCESRGVNAFYVRRDVNVFPVLAVADAWRPLWWAKQVV